MQRIGVQPADRVGEIDNTRLWGTMVSVRAEALFRRRVVVAPDAFVEVVVWRVPKPVGGGVHRFKYRLAYIVAGECVVRYDNERGKGDHRHWGVGERPYGFTTVDRLMADFSRDIARWNHGHGRS